MTDTFNNPDVLAVSWYPVLPSRKLKRRQVRNAGLHKRRITLYRGDDGAVRAIHSNCAHLGADLGQGAVIGNELRCPFHHWMYGQNGKCTHIPYRQDIPSFAKVFSYPVEERYGYIWIFNGAEVAFPLPSFDQVNDQNCFVRVYAITLNCHPHIITSNAYDIQHWKALHELDFSSAPSIKEEDGFRMRADFKFQLRSSRWNMRMLKWLRGKNIDFSCTTWGGNLVTSESAAGKNSVKCLFAHSPRPDGSSATLQFLFIPRTVLPGFHYILAPFIRAFVHAFISADMRLLNEIDFWPRFTEDDSTLKLFVNRTNRIGYFEPS
jgi:phenylpropionate dioxygenase-like ring-hydroxylating dioxygenase large terminal subunit